MCRQSATVCLIKSPSRQHRAIADLAERLATLPDPRDRRGRRHPFVCVLLVACSAVVTGAKSFAAIGQWAHNAPQDALIRLGARAVSVFGVRIAPSTATIRRIINTVCPGGLADLLGCDPADADTLAVDGKSARGSRHGTTPAAHLLAAMTGSGQTVTQLRVPDKSRVAGGNFTPGSRGTVPKDLPLHGSCHPDHQPEDAAAVTFQCANMRGVPLGDFPHLPKGLAQRREPPVLLSAWSASPRSTRP